MKFDDVKWSFRKNPSKKVGKNLKAAQRILYDAGWERADSEPGVVQWRRDGGPRMSMRDATQAVALEYIQNELSKRGWEPTSGEWSGRGLTTLFHADGAKNRLSALLKELDL